MRGAHDTLRDVLGDFRREGLTVAQTQQVLDTCVHERDSACGSSSSRMRTCARESCDLEKLVVRPSRRPISAWVYPSTSCSQTMLRVSVGNPAIARSTS